MTIDHLKQVITDQRRALERRLNREKIVKRDLHKQKIERYLAGPNIVLITGVRRSGKSTLAAMSMADKKYGQINFDDNELIDFAHQDFNKLLQAFYELYGTDLEFFVFDEMQRIEGWELFATKLRQDKKIIVTGSNANLLSSELATHLTGRHLDITLLPFSFAEFLRYQHVSWQESDFFATDKRAEFNQLLDQYLRQGGFPEAYQLDERISQVIYQDIISKDILFRHKIRHWQTFQEIARYLLSNFTQQFTYTKIKNTFQVRDAHTVKDYVSYLEESFLLQVLSKFSFKLKQQSRAAKKIYAIDTGLVNQSGFQFSRNQGPMLENTIFLQLQRSKHYQHPDWEIFYWQDYQGHEVDFVVKAGRKIKSLIQVAWQVEDEQTLERETRSLLKARQELQCERLLLLTRDRRDVVTREGQEIRLLPAWQWLLQVSVSG